MTPETRALLALFDHIPYSQMRDGSADRIMITLRSSRTHAEMVADLGWDTTDPDVRWTHGRAIEAAETDPDGYWEQDWPLTQPRPDGPAAQWSVDEWAAYEAGQFPAGYFPIHVGRRRSPVRSLPEGMADEVRDELRGGSVMAVRQAAQRVEAAGRALDEARAVRDAAIRAALGAGVRTVDVIAASGVNAARVYQLRGRQ